MKIPYTARTLGVAIALTTLSIWLTPEAEAARIVRVVPELRAEESFHRIPEFFTGREYTGRRSILRTDPDTREGFYLTARLRRNSRSSFARVTARLELAMPEEQEIRTYEFPLESVERRRPLVLFGVTGPDWPEDVPRPLAWKVSLLDADGQLLDSEQSFLWSMEPAD